MQKVFYEDDVVNAIRAAAYATGVYSDIDLYAAQDYQAGYRAALETLALAFGVLDKMRQAELPAGSDGSNQ